MEHDDAIDSLTYCLTNTPCENIFNFDKSDYIFIPRKSILEFNVETSFSSETLPKVEIRCINPICIKEQNFNNILKNMKGKQKMEEKKYNELIKRYEKNKIVKILKQRDKEIDEIVQKSPEYQIALKYEKKANEEFEKSNKEYLDTHICMRYTTTNETDKKIKEIEEKYNKKINELNTKMEDAKIMLDMAETFDQKMAILVNYDIVNDEGVLNR